LFRCRKCGDLPISKFSASALQKAVHCCKACVRLKNKRYHSSHKDVFKAAELRRRLKVNLTGAEVSALFSIYGRKCFVTGQQGRLTIIRADPRRGWGTENLVPVHSALSRVLKDGLPPEAKRRWLAQRCIGGAVIPGDAAVVDPGAACPGAQPEPAQVPIPAANVARQHVGRVGAHSAALVDHAEPSPEIDPLVEHASGGAPLGPRSGRPAPPGMSLKLFTALARYQADIAAKRPRQFRT